jgi:hypothetical protein
MTTAASSFFHCRICGHNQYSPVRTRLPSGAWDATGYWKCMGCSVMFTDPKAFSSQSTAEPQSASQTSVASPAVNA